MSSPWAETLPAEEQYRSVELAPHEALVGYLAREDRAVAQLLVERGEHIPVATPQGLVARMRDAQTPDTAVQFKAGMVSQSLADNHIRGGSLQVVGGTPEYPTAVYKPADMESDIADATAGHLLAIARDFGSLQAIFGTNRGGPGQTRSPQSLMELAVFFASDNVAVGEDFTLKGLAERSSVDYHAIRDHMERLSNLGLIEYDTTVPTDVIPTFTIVPDTDPLVSTHILGGEERRGIKTTHAGEMTYRTEVGLIIARFQAEQRTSFTYDDIVTAMERPEEVGMSGLRNTVSQMISEGILKRQHPAATDGGAAFSHVVVTEDTKQLMQRIARMYQGLDARHIAEQFEDETEPEEGELLPPDIDQEVLAQGLRYARAIMGNRGRVTALLQQGKENSVGPRIGNYAQWSGIAVRALVEAPNGELSTEELWGTNFGPDSLSIAGLRAVLNSMLAGGVVTKRKDGIRRVWALTA